MGGGQPEGIQDVLQVSSAGGVAVQVGYMGAEPPHWTGPEEFSAQGYDTDHKETAKATRQGGIGISTAGGSNGGGGFRGDQDLHPQEAGQGCSIYCDATYAGPLQEVGAEARVLGLS